MAYDSEILFRAASAGNLTADFAGSFVETPPGGKMVLRVVVPQMAETNDTIVVTVTYSDDGSTATETITLATITKANVDAGITQYFFPIHTNRQYIKVGLDVTDADSGSDFNAGAVVAGLTPGGQYLAGAVN